MLVTARNVNAGIQVPQRSEEVLIWEKKKCRRCYNIWHQSCYVCVRVWWQSFSSTQLKTHEETLEANLPQDLCKEVLGSESGHHFQRWCSCEAVRVSRVQGLRWKVIKKTEQWPCGWDGKVGRHYLGWSIHVLQLLNVHTLKLFLVSCNWVAFSGLLWTWNCGCMIEHSLLVLSLGLLLPYESLGMWWHLVTAREFCMLNHFGEHLFQPQVLVITWTAKLWYLCSL